MKGTIITLTVGGGRHITPITAPPSAEQLQKIVGGYIELVPYFPTFAYQNAVHRCAVFCNENGKLAAPNPLPLNEPATRAWAEALARLGHTDPMTDYLVGNIAVVLGDDELMESL